MNLRDIKQKAEQTAEAWDHLAGLLAAEPGLDNLRQRLTERAHKLRDNRFTILVVGEFKRGKSTVLNAMLGQRVLPQKVTPCTAIVTLIRYGEPPSIEVIFDDGKTATLTPDEFKQKYELKVEDTAWQGDVTSNNNDELENQFLDRFGNIKEAVISYPLALCRDGVELVDSPGLGEHPARERRVIEFLTKADAIVMVLSATQLLNQRELRFITHTLAPLGKRHNLFFLINRWNQILEGLVNPDDPEEVSREFAEQEKLIDARLKPLCRVDGNDLSAKRIFRINALGALQERLATMPNAAKLRETNVPAFEDALANFLREERHRARQLSDGTLVRETRAALKKFVDVQKTILNKPVEELKKKHAELQPKLQMLRDVAQQIDNSLTAKASVVSQALCNSFDEYASEHIEKPLPEMVDGLDLGPADSIFMSFDAAMDLFRPEGKKFRDRISAHLQRQISQYFKPKLNAWANNYAKTILNGMAVDLKRDLQKEAGKYLGVLEQIDEQMGQPGQGLTDVQQVQKWLSESLTMQGGVSVGITHLGLDLAPLMATVLVDVLAHMALNILPGIGLLISGILMFVRWKRVREKLRSQVLEGIRSKMPEFRLSQHEAIREAVSQQFRKLRNQIVRKIEDDIALIDGSIKTLIIHKERHQTSTKPRLEQLDALMAAAETELKKIEELIK